MRPILQLFADAITAHNANAVVETIDCCKEASWQADVIIVAAPEERLIEIAEKIKPVTTCKPVLHFATATGALLPGLLPYANVVTIGLGAALSDDNSQLHAVLQGTDTEALTLAQSILHRLGCGVET